MAQIESSSLRAVAMEGQAKEAPFRGKALRGEYRHGSRVHTFDRLPAQTPAKNAAFSGHGFMPPHLFAGHAPVCLHEASATTLENEGVHGREGMMPPAGGLGRLQRGQKMDEGSGGAGSFATVTAFGAKMNG
jgi:hypothetical protein